ncbi:MAG TPA: hypothetical protein VHJ20_00775 [Polyangia bacterium]|nr:hypothetical protein [Polyangia bacterium]
MTKGGLRRAVFLFGAGGVLFGVPARADIPAGYKGLPFDPAVAGGAGVIPSTVKAGPYEIPGRLDFPNYDLGGEQVAYHAGDHITTKNGDGYRTDRPTATMCKTDNAKMDVWYNSGTAMDGMFFPSATTTDFYLGAIQVNDWFNFTVDVKTAGMYTVSSTWSTGNGPPGGEGGDGQVGLEIFTNGTKVGTWTAAFPNYTTTANFHNWKPYPAFATVTLPAGIQVIKLQSTTKHLNLDYVVFDLVGGGAGGSGGATATGGSTGAGGATATGGSTGTGGATATGGSTGTGGATATGGSTGEGGSTGAGGATSEGGSTGATGEGGSTSEGGSNGSTGGGGSTTGGGKKSSGGCSIAAGSPRAGLASGAIFVALAFAARRRRRVGSNR